MDERPQSITRWLLGFVMPAKLNDQMLRLAESAKIRQQVDSSHLLTPPSSGCRPLPALSTPTTPAGRLECPVHGGARRRVSLPLPSLSPLLAHSATPSGPPRPPGAPTPSSRSTARFSLRPNTPLPPSPTTPTQSGLAYALNSAPESPATSRSSPRRPRVLNQIPLEHSVQYTDAPEPPSPSRRSVVPSLETLERCAAYVLHMEQYYDSLGRERARSHKVDIGSFDLGRVIGQGAFGVVRIARERAKGRTVAIKQLRKSDLLKMGQEGHVRAEKDVLASASLFDSTWIPRLYYTFQDRDHLFLVLEFMGGGDLLSLLISRGRLPEPMVRFYAAEMVLALHQCHSLGYIHRDVKPDNFLFNKEGHLRIADFGLATDLHWSHDSSYYESQRRGLLKRFGYPVGRAAFGNKRRSRQQLGIGPQAMSEAAHANSAHAGLHPKRWGRPRRQLAYTICGTNSYMAPEVIMGTGYGFGADWWGLGVIVYEALYGAVPFSGENRHIARQKILDWRTSLVFPREPRVSPLAVDFMRQLMCSAEDRLGYCRKVGHDEGPLGNDGAQALMRHPWFAGVDFEHITEQTPPFAPALTAVDDTRHFDADIPDEPLAPANSGVEIKDPLLGHEIEGKHLLEIRKQLAFKQWTFRSPCAHEWRYGHKSRVSRANSSASANSRVRTSSTATRVPARGPPTVLEPIGRDESSSIDIDLDFDRCSASTSFHPGVMNGAGLTVLPVSEQRSELPRAHVRTNRYEERMSASSFDEDNEEHLDTAVEWEDMFRKRTARMRTDLKDFSVKLSSLNASIASKGRPVTPAHVSVLDEEHFNNNSSPEPLPYEVGSDSSSGNSAGEDHVKIRHTPYQPLNDQSDTTETDGSLATMTDDSNDLINEKNHQLRHSKPVELLRAHVKQWP